MSRNTKTLLKYPHYYPFGLMMSGRSWSEGYRFGFNGKENTNEVYGGGNAVDFGARMYDARLGRWFSIDSESDLFLQYSSYCFAINSPLIVFDVDGNIIRVVGSEEYKKEILGYLQTLTNDEITLDDNGNLIFLNSVESPEYKEGTDLIRFLADNSPGAKVVTITDNLELAKDITAGDGPETLNEEGKNFKEGDAGVLDKGRVYQIGSGSMVYFPIEYQSKSKIVNELGEVEKVISEKFVVLAHELFHSKDIWNGVLDRSLSKEIAISFDPGQEWVDANTHQVRRTPGSEPKKNSEVNAIIEENKIRNEHGMNLRILGVSTKDGTYVLPKTE